MPQPHSALITASSNTALDTAIGRVAEPSPDKLRLRGIFFAILRVNDINTIASWAEPFLDYLSQSYYSIPYTKQKTSIERLVSIVNQKARAKLRQLDRERHTVSPDNLSYLIGALLDKEVALCHSGGANAYLLHCMSKNGGPKRYRWIHITSSDVAVSGEVLAPTATTIISGKISEQDTLFICTESVAEALSLEKIQTTIAELPMSGVHTILKKQLEAVGGRRGYAAIVIRALEPAHYLSATKSDQSMATLRDYEQGANRLLMIPSARPWKRLWQVFRELLTKPTKKSIPRPTAAKIKSLGWRIGKRLRQLMGIMGYLVVRATLFVIHKATDIPRLMSINGLTNLHTKTTKYIDDTINNITAKLNTLPKSAKRLLIIALLLGFLFVQSLVFLALKQTRESNIAETNHIVNEINESLDQAQANIIFDNYALAQTLTLKAEALLATLPNKTREERSRSQILASSIADIKAKLERLTVIDNPTTVATLTNVFNNPQGILVTANTILLYNSQTSFAIVNPANKTVTSQTISDNTESLSSGKIDDVGNFVFRRAGGGLAVVDLKTDTLTRQNIADEPTAHGDFVFYGNRLYLIDPAQSQIWRYRAEPGGYGNRAPWVEENAPAVSEAVSIVVDGHVYLLSAKGKLTRLSGGTVEQNWLSEPLISLNGALTKLLSPEDSTLLYALAPEDKRVVVWEKESGKLRAQYSLPSLNNIKDFAVDEENKMIYILTDEAVVNFKF